MATHLCSSDPNPNDDVLTLTPILRARSISPNFSQHRRPPWWSTPTRPRVRVRFRVRVRVTGRVRGRGRGRGRVSIRVRVRVRVSVSVRVRVRVMLACAQPLSDLPNPNADPNAGFQFCRIGHVNLSASFSAWSSGTFSKSQTRC